MASYAALALFGSVGTMPPHRTPIARATHLHLDGHFPRPHDHHVQGLVAGALGVRNVVVKLPRNGFPELLRSTGQPVAAIDGVPCLGSALVVDNDPQCPPIVDLIQATILQDMDTKTVLARGEMTRKQWDR